MTLRLAVVFVLAFARCGGGTGPGGEDMAATTDMATNNGGGDMASGGGDMSASGGDMATIGRHEDVMVGGVNPPCFALATGASTSDNPCPGDIVFLMGAKVDLQSADANGAAFCQLPGSFNQLSDVPTNYSMCNWIGYVEGGAGLANAGFILRDRAAAHHYRARIVSNDLPHLVFDYAPID